MSLSLRDKRAVHGKALFPPNNLPAFGGIRDAAPDAWGRRVIESRLKVPANSLPESAYLLHAGSQRVGALDIRAARESSATPGFGTWDNLEYLMEAAQRIDEGLPVPAELEEIFAEGSALGGARPKATVGTRSACCGSRNSRAGAMRWRSRWSRRRRCASLRQPGSPCRRSCSCSARAP